MNRIKKGDTRKRIGFTSLLIAFIFISFMLLNPTDTYAAKIKVSGTLKSQTSYQIKLKKYKKITHWKIRMAKHPEEGKQKFKNVKTMKVSKKSYTIKNLKPDQYYDFEIIGCTKKNGKLKGVIYEYDSCYTGMSTVSWDEYASSDAPCSPQSISIWGYASDDGFPAEGIELYRRDEGPEGWDLISTVDGRDLRYDDKDVQPGKTYEYRFRSFGTYKGKKLYSPYTDELSRSAVHQTGKFTSSVISQSKSKLVILLTSEQYNGVLEFRADLGLDIGKDMQQLTDYEGIPLVIEAISKDGQSWTTLKEKEVVKIGGGESLYLKFKPNGSQNISSGKALGGDGVTYNRLPSIFDLELGGEGKAYMNAEALH
ncbi:MAG: hypothetical protein K6E75_08755 [Lachnospiraceae bacterium]|nr:hypothetical protein [Lachnospiraceae bacterium]